MADKTDEIREKLDNVTDDTEETTDDPEPLITLDEGDTDE